MDVGITIHLPVSSQPHTSDLMRHNVEATNGNCGKRDSTAVLEVPVGVGENRAITTDGHLTEHEVNDMLMRHKVNNDSRNTVLETAVLDVIRESATVNGKQLTTHDVQIARQYDLLPSIQLEDDMVELPANPMSTYKHAVVAYIAGFVCLMAKKRLSCDSCKAVLCSGDGRTHQFVTMKDRGGIAESFSECRGHL